MNKETMQLGGVVIAIVMGLVSIFLNSTVDTNEDVIALKPQVELNKIAINELNTKFEDRKTNGELPLDVAQNKDIEYLIKKADNLDKEVELVKQAIQKILIEISK